MIKIEEWTDSRIDTIKDKGAIEFIRTVVRSPFLDGYLAILTIITSMNAELQGTVKSLAQEDVDASKTFAISHKYILEMQSYYDQLEYFRKKLLPDEVDKAHEIAADLLDQARINMKKRNGKV